MVERLLLRAEDAEDLAVISSCLQDALVPLSDMRYEPAERRFVMAVNRFRWEACGADGPERGAEGYQRIACAITIEAVRRVAVRGIDQSKRERLHELLAVRALDGATEAAPSPAVIELAFAGGGAIRLEVDRIACRLKDFGEPWPTRWQPTHRTEPGRA